MLMSLLHEQFKDLPLFRSSDPSTSRKAAEQVAPRRGSQMARLLACYTTASLGLTDDQAGQRVAENSSVIPGYWKRCADLRRLGYIVDTHTTRPTLSGSLGMVCVISAAGIEALK
jgi:hypothetical protein